MNSPLSKKLAEAYLQSEEAYMISQCELPYDTEQLLKLRKSDFYAKSLASLAVCNEVLLTNAQYKELNYHRIKMLRSRIGEVSLQLEHYKLMLKSLQPGKGLDKN